MRRRASCWLGLRASVERASVRASSILPAPARERGEVGGMAEVVGVGLGGSAGASNRQCGPSDSSWALRPCSRAC